MKKVDEAMKAQMQADGEVYNFGASGGAMQNRLSAKCNSVKDI